MEYQISDARCQIIVLLLLCCSVSFAVELEYDSFATGIIKQDAKKFIPVCLEDAKKTFFDENNMLMLLTAGGGSIALQDRADERAANHFKQNGKMSSDMDKLLDWTGCPATHFAATGIWYLMSANKEDDKNLQRSWVMLRALSVTGATTLTLKMIVNNHTPNGKNLAWPSGHTSSSFCVAAVLDEFYGPKIGIPAYLLAGTVGYRMMESGDHWASDVLFGGVLGYIVGHSIAGEHKQLEIAGYKIQPTVMYLHKNPAAGFALAKRF